VKERFLGTVVELILTLRKREGVQYLFGISGGGGTIDLLDATEKDGIRFGLSSYETVASGCLTAP
jgi:thiamine pyrophosphate-dependent acetolactate synthase large subunit-like protein